MTEENLKETEEANSVSEEKTETDNVEIEETVENATTEEVNEVEQLQNQVNEMEDKFLRAQAEIANMHARHRKEREDLAKYRSQDLAKELLSALDNLDRALAIEVTNESGNNLKKGIEMVRESMVQALKSVGVEEIKASGEIFDPSYHQAVQTVALEDGQKADEIVQVLQKGYQLHDRVLRPTMVIVAQ